jgi:hypothetical protein
VATPLSLIFDILAVDRASEVFNRVGAAAEGAGVKTESGMAKVGAAADKVGKGLALAGAAATVYSVKIAADFQQATNILVTSAGESAGALAGVRKGILDIAQNTGTKWQDLTDGMYQIEKAGIRGADGLTVLKAAAQAAREEGANLATVTNATTSVMASYGLGADQAVSVTNQMKTAAGEAKTTMELFAGSLSTVLPLASKNNISFADIAGTLASLTMHGTSADQAAQELAFSMRNLAAPNNVAIQMMNQLGISSIDVATKLGDGPGGRGLAGTMQYLSQTVLEKMGPSGLVLLGTMRQSATAANDMQLMLAKMPPAVRKLADEFNAGTVTLGEFRAGVKYLPADQAMLAQQFLVLANNANGFSQAIRRGGPAADTYSADIKAMMGGANGLNAVLQTTGASMDSTTGKISAIAEAGKNAGKDVAGWESTQKLFNVQLDRFKQTVQASAINLGTQLLPAVTAVFGYLSSHKAVVEGVAIAAAAFGLAWAAVKVTLGTVSAITTTIGAIKTLGTELMLLPTRAALAALSMGEFATSAWAAVAPIVAIALPIAAAVAAIGGIAFIVKKVMDQHAAAKKAAQDWSDGQILAAKNASGSYDLFSARMVTALSDVQQQMREALKASSGLAALSMDGVRAAGAYKQLSAESKVLTAEMTRVNGAFEDAARLTGLTKDQLLGLNLTSADLKLSQKELAAKLVDMGSAAAKAADPNFNLSEALKQLGSNTKTAAAQADDLQNALMAFGNPAAEATRSALKFRQDIEGMGAAIKDSGTSLDLNTTAGLSNIAMLQSAAQDALKMASAQASVEGASFDMKGALEASRTALEGQALSLGFNKDQADRMIGSILNIPPEAITQYSTPGSDGALSTAQQIKAAVDAIPNIQITANLDDKATAGLMGLKAFADNAAGTGYLQNLANMPGFAALTNADGGPIVGRGTGTSDSILSWVSNGEYVVKAASAAAIGTHALNHINDTGQLPRFAAGGQVLFNDIAPKTSLDVRNIIAAMVASGSSTPGPGGDVERWRRVVDIALRMLGQPLSLDSGVLSLIAAESGGNPRAINLTDSNALAGHPSQGLMQTIPSTFEAYRSRALVDNILDPLANIFAGVNYALANYGPGMLAAGGRHGPGGAYVGYESGTSYVPRTGPALLHEGEAVLTRQQNADRRSAPLIHVEHQHIEDAVGLDAVLRQAEFRERQGHFG